MRDLTTIPQEFHILFLDDNWKKGIESNLSSTEKMYYAKLFNDYNKWSVKNAIEKNKTYKPILGEEEIEKEKL